MIIALGFDKKDDKWGHGSVTINRAHNVKIEAADKIQSFASLERVDGLDLAAMAAVRVVVMRMEMLLIC